MATSTIGSDESPVLAVGDEDVVPDVVVVPPLVVVPVVVQAYEVGKWVDELR